MSVVLALALLALFAAAMVGTPALLTGRSWMVRYPKAVLLLWLSGVAVGVAALVASLVVSLHAAQRIACHPGAPGCPSVGLVSAGGVYVVGWILTAVVGGLASLFAFHAIEAWREGRVLRSALLDYVVVAGTEHVVRGHPVHSCRLERIVAMGGDAL